MLRDYLMQCQISSDLFPEILDHLTCDAEEKLWDGESFEQAFRNIVLEADAAALINLSEDTRALLAQGQSLNDMVFEGRNQQYGAYALRKGYGETMQRSVLMGVTLFLLLVMIPELYARLEPEKSESDIAFELQMDKVTIRPEQSGFSSAVSLDKARKEISEPFEEKVVPVKTYLMEIDPDFSSSDGVRIGSPEFFESTTTADREDTSVFEVGELSDLPEFRGGKGAMDSYLKTQMKYPQEAENACAEGIVEMKVILNRSGQIERAIPLYGPGYRCETEAQRLVLGMPQWKPGLKDGKPVKVCMTLPIVFTLPNASF
jgi:protein TonB